MTPLPTLGANVEATTPGGGADGRWWQTESDGRILCELCPRACRLRDGDRGFCFVRRNSGGRMVLDTYGRSTGFCIDPIEKKPLNHFLPGTSVLSFGTAGCNLGCKFCQNWDISKSREVDRLSAIAAPDAIAQAAASHQCRSVAFTYNDPVIWAEYAIDTAAECRRRGIQAVAVTAGYVTPQARGEFFEAMDAANIDLKGFSEEFYFGTTGAHLQPVLDTIRFACQETDCWVELTNLLIPDANDDDEQLRRLCDWVLQEVGDEVPIHFTAFHPDFRMKDRPRTPASTLIRAYDVARQAGLRYVYVGNIHDVPRQSTACPSCGNVLIERDWHELGQYTLRGNRCGGCGCEIAGRFETAPGNWGRRRQPIRIAPLDNRPPTALRRIPTSKQADTMNEATSERMEFDSQQQSRILQVAGRLVRAAVDPSFELSAAEELGDLADVPIRGVYVTLKRGETLRGCCGWMGPGLPLAAALADAARRTAKEDPRMPAVTAIELPHLSLSVSILGASQPVEGDQRAEAIEIGKHGLRIALGDRVGLLLPVVARERGWDADEFLEAVCRKAGLPPGSWRHANAELRIFEGVDFGAPMSDLLDGFRGQDEALFDAMTMRLLHRWVQSNMVALQTGATPFYYCPDVSDASVPGVILDVTWDDGQPASNWIRLVLRQGVPLQSTLFELTQTAVKALEGRGSARDWKVRLAVLSGFVHHGDGAHSDLQGFDPSRRAVVLMDGRRCAVQFDAAGSADQERQRAMSSQPFRGSVQVYSAVCDCTAAELSCAIGEQAESEISSRLPGVAGSFYPAEDVQREELLDQLLTDLPEVTPRRVASAMVPHAGLRFSGKTAAEVWRRIELPREVLIIGPKHTNDGVDWAVAPHDQWQISATASLAGAVDLAQGIADSVPGMALDAAAHRAEHGIEVQLPLLHRLAPETRVAAIAMRGGAWGEIEEAAEALAEWMRSLKRPPLLVISSDMNHFADDGENRRRDAIALAALKANDPRGLLEVCQQEEISMCGRIPAALVLLTLKALGQTPTFEQVAYATSGDVTGDRSRVVGYAGVLF